MKKLRALVVLGILLLLGTYTAQAQMLREYSAFHRSIGLTLGSYGIGVEGSYPVGQKFNVRAGATVFPPGLKLGKPGSGANGQKYEFNRAGVTLMVDWQPLFGQESEFASKWFVTAGAGIFFKNEISNYGKNYMGGNSPQYTVPIKQAPYLGTGLGNLVLGDRIGLSLNAGYYFSYTKEVPNRYNSAGPNPAIDQFPLMVVKGFDGHATISYNF